VREEPRPGDLTEDEEDEILGLIAWESTRDRDRALDLPLEALED
jgi:hypothetical protein